MPPKKEGFKPAKRQYNWELPDSIPLRVNSAMIPGGKCCKKGGKISDDLVPPPEAVALGGKQLYNDGRGNIRDLDEAIKPLTAGKKGKKGKKDDGLMNNITNIANKDMEAGSMQGGEAGASFVGVKSGKGKKKAGGIQSGVMPQTVTNALQAPLLGLAKKEGGAKAKRKNIADSVKAQVACLEASIKQLKKVIKKVK